jgi:ComEC/Rec2-related protein
MDAAQDAVADERRHFDVGVFTPRAATPGTDIAPEYLQRPSKKLKRVSLPSWRWLGDAFDTERDHGNGFLFVPIFLAAGILAYFALPDEPSLTLLLLAVLFLSGIAMLGMSSPGVKIPALALMITACGMISAKLETTRTATPMLGSEISTRITARVQRIEQQASGRVRLTLDVMATERPVLRYAPQRIRATARAVPAGLRPGEVVQGVVRIMPPSGPVRPQSYDFAFKSYFDGIGGVGFFLSNPERLNAAPAGSLSQYAWNVVEHWRLRMADRISSQIEGPEGAIAAALITGIRAGIPETTSEALRIAGLYHVISISGLHMALVGGTVMLTMRALFALAPTFSARRPVKKYAAATALGATAFYLLISGADVAAQRSFIMLAVMLVAILVDRAALTMRNLAISAIIILLIAPHEVVGPSFQMSFAATAALVAAYAAWTQWRGGRAYAKAEPRGPIAATIGKTAKYVAGMSMTSIVAGMATALFTAWHFQQVSPMGLFANLAAMPFVSILVMPMAVLASLLMPLGLDGPPLQVMGFGITAMNVIAVWLAERSAFDATGAVPLSAVLTLTTALAILTMSGSALRWAAVPFLIAGVTLLIGRSLPDVMVSEDAKIVAVRLGNGSLAVNRARPRAFTIENWHRALNTAEIIRPASDDKGSDIGGGFICKDTMCVARHASGGLIVHSTDVESARTTCKSAILIVIQDATAHNPCGGSVAVITGRDLARNGSAEITVELTNDQPRAMIRYAMSAPYRPWHDHRRFSREARGLAPYSRARSQERAAAASSD